MTNEIDTLLLDSEASVQEVWIQSNRIIEEIKEEPTIDIMDLPIPQRKKTKRKRYQRRSFPDPDSNRPKFEWSQSLILRFIADYKKSTILWNIQHKEYNQHPFKGMALARLAKRYKCDVIDVKKRIKNLRSAFNREHLMYTKQKIGPMGPKRKRWFAYQPLTFLLDPNQPIDDSSNDVEWDDDIDDPLLPTIEQHDLHEDDRTQMLPQEIPPSTPSLRYIRTNTNADDCSVYGEHVANEIRKLTPTAQTNVKHLMNNILFDAAFGKYDDRVAVAGRPHTCLTHLNYDPNGKDVTSTSCKCKLQNRTDDK